jgi:hypothetical protein
MPVKNLKEGVRPAAIILPFVYGVLGLIILFAAGSRSGSTTFAAIAICSWFLIGAFWFARKFSSGWLLIGVLMNLPLWLSFVLLAEAGQSAAFFWGLAASLGFAYLGVLLGRWCSTMRPLVYRRVFALGVSAVIVVLVILFTTARMPTSIPSNKQEFVGRWKSASGFELQIESDGTARILNNSLGGPSLSVAQGPNSIEQLHVYVVGDTILDLIRPSYYGRTYKIDRYPYRDGSVYVMTLNGIRFRKQD